jgi:ABC-type glycerol-3-phosphate transport system substrate-binding protein
MNLRISAILAAVLLVSACGSNEEPAATETADASVVLNEMFAEYADRYLEMNPLQATFIGINRYNDRMANSGSPEYRAAAEAMDEEFLQRLLAIDRE